MMVRRLSLLLVGTFVATHVLPAMAQEFDLQPPGDREFSSDKAVVVLQVRGKEHL